MSENPKMDLLAKTDADFNACLIEGVSKDVAHSLQGGRYRAAAILVYCGIDTMASLMRPDGKPKVDRGDFIEWVEKYLDFGVENGPSGLEIYAARCGMLHANSSESVHTDKGNARQIGYVDRASKRVLVDPAVPTLILVSTQGLVLAFLEGVNKSWQDIKASEESIALTHRRLQTMFQETTPASLADTEK